MNTSADVPSYPAGEGRPQQDEPVRRSHSALGTTAVIGVFLASLAVHPYAPTIALVALMAWALLGARQALEALSLMVVIKFLNPAVYEFAGPLALLPWLALAVAGTRILYDSLRLRRASHPVIPWLLIFALVVAVQSAFVSQYALVSVFKLTSFTFAAAVILLGFRVCSAQSVDWSRWFVGLWCAVLLLSIPTWLDPGIAFHRNGRGFQGILSHPQTLAAFLAPMVGWLTGRAMLSESKESWRIQALLPVAWIMMLMTGARTALIAVIAGFLGVLVVALLRRSAWRRLILKAARKPLPYLLLFGAVLFAALRPGLISEQIAEFIRKGEENVTIGEAFEDSRGAGIESQWRNFLDHPVSGIGFGVSLDPSFQPLIEPVTGLPLSASVEKGFLPSAILEETGIIGTACFLAFLIALMLHGLSKTDPVIAWVLMTSVAVNVGEMVFFSMNGLGLYIWLLIGWTTSGRWDRN